MPIARFGIVLMLLAWIVSATPVAAQQQDDVVTLRSSRGGGAPRRVRGTVLDYTGQQLIIRDSTTGREATYAGPLVIGVETQRQASQLEGDRLLDECRFELALSQFRTAMQDETRPWVQRQILSRIVWCYANQRQTIQAAENFRILVRNDPGTPWLDCIPLSWSPHQPSVELDQQARRWMADSSTASMRLVGASWLLSAERRTDAVGALRLLATDSDPRLAALAQAQIWRTEIVSAAAADCQGWSEKIERMPAPLRAGPYLVLGRALSRLGQSESAALTLLRVPILYRQHYLLAADGLLAAGRELENLQRHDQALRLYAELVREYPATDAAAEARQRMETLRVPTG